MVSCSYQGAPDYPPPLGSCLVRSSCTRPWVLGFSPPSRQGLTKHLVPRCWCGERASPNTDPRDYVGPVATGVRDRRVSCFVCVSSSGSLRACVRGFRPLVLSHRFPLDPAEIRERSGHPKGLPHNILVSRARLITNFPLIFFYPS